MNIERPCILPSYIDNLTKHLSRALVLLLIIMLVLINQPVTALLHVDTTHDDFFDDGGLGRFEHTIVAGDAVQFDTIDGAWDQSDWSDGPGKSIWNNDHGFTAGDGLEYNTSGELSLWNRAGKWAPRTPMSEDTYGQGIVWTGDRFIITGGTGSTGGHSSVYEYFIETDNWNPLNDMPSDRVFHASAWAGDLYVLGGGGTMDALLIYNRSLNSWANLPDAPINRSRHTMVFDGTDKILVFGGKDDTGNGVADLWSYNITSGSWVPLASAPKALYGHKAIWNHEDKVMLVTGGRNTTNYFWDTWAYDQALDSWTPLAHMPESWIDHSMAWSPELKMAFVYGGVAASDYNDQLYIYSFDDDSWTLGVAGPEGRYGHGGAWADGRMAVFGGYDQTGSLNETWIYQYFVNRSHGWMISSQVDIGMNVDFIDIDWDATVPNETSIGFQVASNTDHITWDFKGPDGTSGSMYEATSETLTDVHNGDRYFKYKVFLTSQNWTRTPVLEQFEITYMSYEMGGYFTSRTFDLLSYDPVVSSIEWDSNEPPGTSIELFVTSGPDEDLDVLNLTLRGEPMTNGQALPDNVSRYLRYEAQLFSSNASLTPSLEEVRIDYTPIPTVGSGMVEPSSGIEGELFNYSVIYTDLAERSPTLAQVIIDGATYDMTTASSSFSNGAVFMYFMALSPGVHNYYFNFRIDDINLRFPETGTLQGPSVKALNQRPVAVITLPWEGATYQVGENVVLRGDRSYDPDLDVLNFKWSSSLINGTLSTEMNDNITFWKEGAHMISLMVSDPFGDYEVAYVNIMILHQINNSVPIPVISNDDFVKFVGDTVTVDATHSRDPDGTVNEWTFDWRDGSNPDEQDNGIGRHTYTQVGTYIVKVTVTDNFGASNYTEINVIIKDVVKPPPEPVPDYNTTVEGGTWFVLVVIMAMIVVFIAVVVARRSKF